METSSLFCRTTSVLGLVLLSFGCDSGSANPNTNAPTGVEGIFEEAPDVPNCVPGKLSMQYQKRFVRRLNQIRAQHQLPPVAITESELGPAQEAALAIVANARIGHGMPRNSICFTEEANRSSIESLLLISAGNEVGDPQDPDRVLRAWMQDIGEQDLGHRRWILDPFVNQVAYGFVMGEAQVEFEFSPVIGATLHVIDMVEPDVTGNAPDFVGFPQGLYPSTFVGKEGDLSFSVIPDKTGRLVNAGKVTFVDTTVEMKDGEKSMTVSGERFFESHPMGDISIGGNPVIGVPNVMLWRVEGLQDNVPYTVIVKDVMVEGELRDYEYEFTLF